VIEEIGLQGSPDRHSRSCQDPQRVCLVSNNSKSADQGSGLTYIQKQD
jgi:hypothetical protein